MARQVSAGDMAEGDTTGAGAGQPSSGPGGGIEVVAIFGPSNDRAWGPYPPDSPRHVVVRERLACAPCIHRGHSFGTPQGCPARTCLDLIEPAQVLAAAERVLAASARRPAGGKLALSRGA